MQLSLNAGIPLPGVVLVGVVNGTGGGLLRDMLVGDTPTILKPGQYMVSALILVCILFLIAYHTLDVYRLYAAWGAIALFFIIRMLSIRYDWQTYPVWKDLPD
jgi:uncharacterized membrane protein YeiH